MFSSERMNMMVNYINVNITSSFKCTYLVVINLLLLVIARA